MVRKRKHYATVSRYEIKSILFYYQHTSAPK